MEWVFWYLAVICVGLILFMFKIATTIWWKLLQVKKSFEAQGIRGPPCRLFYGNSTDIFRMINEQRAKPMPLSHDILPRVLPHVHQWTKTYGTLVSCIILLIILLEFLLSTIDCFDGVLLKLYSPSKKKMQNSENSID